MTDIVERLRKRPTRGDLLLTEAADEITALRAAQGEPVAWQWLDTATFREKIPPTAVVAHWRPLYAAPQQRQPLSDRQCVALWADRSDGPENREIISYARAVEAAHGIGEKQ